MLILNKLLKIPDAQNYQNAGNAVLEYTTSTRSFGRIASALRSSRSILGHPGLQLCNALLSPTERNFRVASHPTGAPLRPGKRSRCRLPGTNPRKLSTFSEWPTIHSELAGKRYCGCDALRVSLASSVPFLVIRDGSVVLAYGGCAPYEFV